MREIKWNRGEIEVLYFISWVIIDLLIVEGGKNMNYLNQEEQEFGMFILECEKKAIEIKKKYNKLSDKNKYRFYLWLEQKIWISIVLGRR